MNLVRHGFIVAWRWLLSQGCRKNETLAGGEEFQPAAKNLGKVAVSDGIIGKFRLGRRFFVVYLSFAPVFDRGAVAGDESA
jgi:hypothetical protein